MTFLARLLGVVWAAPCTALGLLVALFGGTRTVNLGTNWGVFYFEAAPGGLVEAFFKRWSKAGITLGCVVFLRSNGSTVQALVEHELVHVWQYMWWGLFFFPAYGLASLWALLRKSDGYRANWFEQQARNLAGRFKP